MFEFEIERILCVHPILTVSISFLCGFISEALVLGILTIKLWNKREKMKAECEDIARQVKALEEKKALLKEQLTYKLENEIRAKFTADFAKWYEYEKEKAEAEIAFEAIKEMQKVAEEQEKVYKDIPEKLEKVFKENIRLQREIARLRQQISSLKGRFTNHVVTVVKNAKFEVLIHALKQRPDWKNIANVLK